MSEKFIHNLIEQQNSKEKQRVWQKISAQIDAIKQIKLFTYRNVGDGYEKRYIALSDLLARLSDKSSGIAQHDQQNNHPRG